MEINVEKIKDNIDKAAVYTVKKAEEIMSVTKLKFKKTELKGKISDLYKEIGEMVYKASKDEADITDRLEFAFSRLDELHAEVKECNRLMDELKEI